MAKQSGIHQIRGKVGEMSYYQQAGVNAGLVRRINQGLSDRVKTAVEFANTRLNNAEFKTASLVGAAVGHSVIPAWRSMFRRFAQANMVKRLKELIKEDTAHPWGLRLPAGNMGVVAADLLEKYAKAGQYQGQYGTVTWNPSFNDGGDLRSISIDLVIPEETVAQLMSDGINGFKMYIVGAGMFTTIQDSAPRISAGHSAPQVVSLTLVPGSDNETEQDVAFTPQGIGFSPRGFTELQASDNGGMWVVTSIVPIRRVGTTSYELQELATYVAFGSALTNED